MSILLNFEKKEPLPWQTDIYQVEDGDGIEEIDATLPASKITNLAVFGNTFYFVAGRTIYTAVYAFSKISVAPKRNLTEVESVDDRGLITRREEDGSEFVYTMCDNLSNNAISIDPDIVRQGWRQERIMRRRLFHVRRGKQFTLRRFNGTWIGVELPLDDGDWQSCDNEFSRNLYISNGNKIYTLDVEQMAMLPVLEFKDPCTSRSSHIKIIGVVDGVITVTGTDAGHSYGCWMVTARISPGFYRGSSDTSEKNLKREMADLYLKEEQSNNQIRKDEDATFLKNFMERRSTKNEDFAETIRQQIVDEQTNKRIREMQQFIDQINGDKSERDFMDQRIAELANELDKRTERSADEKCLDQQLQKFQFQHEDNESAGDKQRREYENEMSATINELIDKNMELTQQIDELKNGKNQSAEQELWDLCERNSELITKKAEVEALNWELSLDLERTETLNDELEATNALLAKEKEELVKKRDQKSATIEELEEENATIAGEIEELNRISMLNDEIDTSMVDENEELKRRIEIMTKQNEKLAKVLADTNDQSSGEEYEIIDTNQ